MLTTPTPVILIALVAMAACHERSAPTTSPPPPPPPPPPSPVQTVGGCQNVSVDGRCTFTSLSRIRESDGSPVAPDAPVDPGGTATFSAGYDLADGSGASPAIWIRATPGDRPALERYFALHRQARCLGIIIRAPCPPGVHVVVDVPPPPVGTVLRPR